MKVYFTRKRWIMKFEILKKTHLKRNILIGVLVVGVITAVILNFTRAKYKTTQSIPLVNGTINYSLADLNIVAIYVEGESVDTIPNGNYELSSESYCAIDGERDDSISLSYDHSTKALSISPMTKKGTKCYLYFDEVQLYLREEILSHATTQITRSNFSMVVTDTTTETIYYEDTTKGRTYYFAGNPTDNWVKFDDYYWRVIRINEDNSIRLIYAGTDVGGDTHVSLSRFNSIYTNNMYVGYMFQNNVLHGLQDNSTIKDILDSWYQNYLIDSQNYIDGNAGFCGDRTLHEGTGLGTTQTTYGAYNRLYLSRSPSLECSNEDLYTYVGANQGNQALTYPIGLISADETVYAGASWHLDNSEFYLYPSKFFWTMSPYMFYGTTNARVFIIDGDGWLNYNDVNIIGGVRPVINLKSDVTISSGNGTSSQPYVIS